ncbi:MAG: hypothetical protein V4438_04380 [Patescibacteria group bacterium]
MKEKQIEEMIKEWQDVYYEWVKSFDPRELQQVASDFWLSKVKAAYEQGLSEQENGR